MSEIWGIPLKNWGPKPLFSTTACAT